eukprot:gene7601-15574_t
MGAAESNPVRNMDKRTSRREYRDSFAKGIDFFRKNDIRNFQSSTDDIIDDSSKREGRLRVCIRKRPIFQHEINDGEFDVITCLNKSTVVVHDAPAQQLFEKANAMDGHISISMSFIEVAGDAVSDLLNGFAPTQLLTGKDESVHPFPVVEPIVRDAEELHAMILHGCSVRSTAATGVHDSSSRSHAILRIYINTTESLSSYPGQPEVGVEGVLTLVDLAGSEYNIDSAYHSAERRKEGAAINASLSALKDCLRARATGDTKGFVYRGSKLTMALKSSFIMKTASTTVICCVSPASKDTEHSLSTLRHACIMDGQSSGGGGGAAAAETRFLTGGTVLKQDLGDINVTQIAKERISRGKPTDLKTSNGNYFNGHAAPEPDDKAKAKARRIAVSKATKAMSPGHRDVLMGARDNLRAEPRQARRLQRGARQAVDITDGSGDGIGGVGVSSQQIQSQSSLSPSPSNMPRYGGCSAAGVPSHVSTGSRNIDGDARLMGSQSTSRLEPSSRKEMSQQTHQSDRHHVNVDQSSGSKTPAAMNRIQTTAVSAEAEDSKWTKLANLMRASGFGEDEITEAVRYAKLADLMRQNGFSEADIATCKAAKSNAAPAMTIATASPLSVPGQGQNQNQGQGRVMRKDSTGDQKVNSSSSPIVSPSHKMQGKIEAGKVKGFVRPGSAGINRSSSRGGGGGGRYNSNREQLSIQPPSPSQKQQQRQQQQQQGWDMDSPKSSRRGGAGAGAGAIALTLTPPVQNPSLTAAVGVGVGASTVTTVTGQNKARSKSTGRSSKPPPPVVHSPQGQGQGQGQGSKGSSARALTPPPTMSELEQVQQDLLADALTPAARHGLQKRLARLQAVQIRELRQKEQKEREQKNSLLILKTKVKKDPFASAEDDEETGGGSINDEENGRHKSARSAASAAIPAPLRSQSSHMTTSSSSANPSAIQRGEVSSSSATSLRRKDVAYDEDTDQVTYGDDVHSRQHQIVDRGRPGIRPNFAKDAFDAPLTHANNRSSGSGSRSALPDILDEVNDSNSNSTSHMEPWQPEFVPMPMPMQTRGRRGHGPAGAAAAPFANEMTWNVPLE